MNTSLASSKWQAAVGPAVLLSRATLLRSIREFFNDRKVVEVLTPVMSAAAATDPNIHSFSVPLLETNLNDTSSGSAQDVCYLHTSPEFPMKRLLASGSGDIYQICSVFRQGEAGRRHNREFQMLEFYRLGMGQHQLMDEVEELLVACIADQLSLSPDSELPNIQFTRISYFDALERACGLTRQGLSVAAIAAVLKERAIDCPLDQSDDIDEWLDLLFATVVFDSFNPDGFTFLYDYPASQAALARLRDDGDGPLAERFELFYGALELANGFHELEDADQQLQRFENERELRQQRGLPLPPIDTHLIDALRAGLPDCAGVAIGIDRLQMVLTGSNSIADVMAFPADRA